ncbi:MAG: helix-turn-helix domain-containing protein [Oscillospiraceae bacterium]|nr:helix-turn-helix domain-containing protein [Oscillospiraceae bacterium]
MYERFVELLQEQGVTAYRVSKETGVTQTTLSDWKTGRAAPKMATLQKIADYFGVTLDWLCGNSDERSGYSTQPDIILVARHLEDIPEEDRQQVIKSIEDTIELYFKAKGISKGE